MTCSANQTLPEPRQLILAIAGETTEFRKSPWREDSPVRVKAEHQRESRRVHDRPLPNGFLMKLQTAAAIFDAVGSVSVLPESRLSAFSAIAGAGPAFAYAFIDALATAGIQAGLPRPLAQQAACAMLLGSAKLVMESGEHPRALIDQVTSPGGTTIEGMHKLAELGFEHAVHEAVRAVMEKEERMK